jgi:hypothetical protein
MPLKTASRQLVTIVLRSTPAPQRVTTTVKPSVNVTAPNETLSARLTTNNELHGELDSVFSSVGVPLSGPGSWVLETSQPTSTVLNCPNVASQTLTNNVNINVNETCSLELSLLDPSQNATWTLSA